MGQKIGIFYFSGTGNTEYMVRLLSADFQSSGAEVKTRRIEDFRKDRIAPAIDDFDLIGICHPILGFDCPTMLYDFARSLPDGEGKPLFFLKTGGDFHRVNNGSSKSMIRVLRGKGYDPFHDDIVAMPSNWLLAYDDRLARHLIELARMKIKASAAAILVRERKSLPIGFFFRWSMKAIGLLEDKVGAKQFGKYLFSTESCTLCGLCERNCPVGNIIKGQDGMAFGKGCTWCMRCIYSCPKGAIKNKYLDFFILRDGYSLRRLRELPLDPIDFEADRLPFLHRYFRKYAAGVATPGSTAPTAGSSSK